MSESLVVGKRAPLGAAALGIDIGATHTKIGLVGASGRILESLVIPSNLQGRDPAPYLSAVFEAAECLAGAHPLAGIGIALCSLIDTAHTGALLSVNAPALNGVNLQAAFQARFGLPVRILNDVGAYALAEARFGAGKGAPRLLCLGLGTGLAIAAIINDQTVETWGGIPADAGRIVLEPESEYQCNGGVRGSAEALCGTAHIERLARKLYGKEGLTARDVIASAAAGRDPIAGHIMAEIGNHVGHLLALLSPVFFPHTIIITGGTAEAGETFFQAVRARHTALIGDYMSHLVFMETGAIRSVAIVKGDLGPEAAIIGASLSFLQSG